MKTNEISSANYLFSLLIELLKKLPIANKKNHNPVMKTTIIDDDGENKQEKVRTRALHG